MASRPVFVPSRLEKVGVEERMVDFRWFAGMAPVRKQRSIDSLHSELKSIGFTKILEISSKSKSNLGVALSAFNLTFTTKKREARFTVESAFQGSKVFSNGGPYKELFMSSPLDAKRDPRLKSSGDLLSFEFFGNSFPNTPRTFFYDWLYINALYQHSEYAEAVIEYEGFTDIEFNPKKSINCQAHAVALFVSLSERKLLQDALASKDNFLSILKCHYDNQTRNIGVQSSLM